MEHQSPYGTFDSLAAELDRVRSVWCQCESRIRTRAWPWQCPSADAPDAPRARL